MNKTVDVEIAGVDFMLQAEAYELLANYLEEMETIFIALPERKEILQDIESRIAEELHKGNTPKKLILLDQIHAILKKIGSPEEIYQVLNTFEYGQKESLKAKLYRDPDHAILGGVCSGIAAYFDIDPIIVRLLFVIFLFAGGFGLFLYLLLFLIVPEAQTPQQKMEMHGGGNALKKIDRSLQEVAKRFKLQEMTKKIEETIKGKTVDSTPKTPVKTRKTASKTSSKKMTAKTTSSKKTAAKASPKQTSRPSRKGAKVKNESEKKA